MTDVEPVEKSLQKIFCRHRDKQNQILLGALNDISTCHGNHSALIAERGKMYWYRRATCFSQVILVIVTIFVILGVCFLRSCNRLSGFGGCAINLFSLFDECPVAF